MAAAVAGDRGAFARLHEKYAPMVHGILLTRVNFHDADDLVQDVFVHAMGKLRSLRDASAVGPWLATMARRFATAHHRRRRPIDSLPDDVHDRDDRTQTRAGSEAAATKVLDVILSLPETYRETLVLRLVEALTGPQIAAATGMTHGSVRVNLHRGMALLRSRLAETGGIGEAGP